MKERHLDGCYFRVKRGEKWENLCFTDLTAVEQRDILRKMTMEMEESLVLHLAERLRLIMVCPICGSSMRLTQYDYLDHESQYVFVKWVCQDESCKTQVTRTGYEGDMVCYVED